MGKVKFTLPSWFFRSYAIFYDTSLQLLANNLTISALHPHSFHLKLRISALRLPTVHFSALDKIKLSVHQTWYAPSSTSISQCLSTPNERCSRWDDIRQEMKSTSVGISIKLVVNRHLHNMTGWLYRVNFSNQHYPEINMSSYNSKSEYYVALPR